MKINRFLISAAALALVVSCADEDLVVAENAIIESSSYENYGISLTCDGLDPSTHFCDSRDNTVYRWVDMDGQIWMAENLNYNASSSRCYNDDASYCETYGRLYDWNTAQTACPAGWKLPSEEEWIALFSYAKEVGDNCEEDKDAVYGPYGGCNTAGKHLKAKEGWRDCGPSDSGSEYESSCEDTYGFSALPGGNGYSDDDPSDAAGEFHNAGEYGHWWSSSDIYAYQWHMPYNYDFAAYITSGVLKSWLQSVRCVKDN